MYDRNIEPSPGIESHRQHNHTDLQLKESASVGNFHSLNLNLSQGFGDKVKAHSNGFSNYLSNN